jgi:transcriptional regulator with XRE-family HTH domain
VSSAGQPRSRPELAERIRSILAAKRLTLHQASERSVTLFGRSSPYYLPHNLYYDLAHGGFSPSLFQLFSFSKISGYRLRDWLLLFGFDVSSVPPLQIALPSRRTALLDSSLEDPNARFPWFRSLGSGTLPNAVTPLSKLLQWTEPQHARSLPGVNDENLLYAKIGREDAMAFPELLPASIVRVNPGTTREALQGLKRHGFGPLFLIQHGKGFSCCHIRLAGNERIATISSQLPYAQVEFRFPEEAKILGVVDLEIRRMFDPQMPSIPKALAKRWKPKALAPEPGRLGQVLRRARLDMGLSFRAAAALSRQVADTLGDARYFTASGSLSDYETLDTPPRHVHKIFTFCAVYSLPLNAVFQAVGLSTEDAGQEPIPDLLTTRTAAAPDAAPAGVIENAPSGFMRGLQDQLGAVPLFLRRSVANICGIRRVSLKDIFWIGGTVPVHPYLAGGVLAVVDRQRKKPNDCGSKSLWQQPLYVVMKRDSSYVCGCCSRENGNLVLHTYAGGLHKQEQFRDRDAEVVGKIVLVARKL